MNAENRAPENPGVAAAPRKRRFRWQFTVRSLLVFVTVASLALSYLVVQRNAYERECLVAYQLEKATGLVCERDDRGADVTRRLLSFLSGRDYRPVTGLGPSRPNSSFIFGERFSEGPATERDNLASIKELKDLRTVTVSSGYITDAALGHLGELPNLESIVVYEQHFQGRAFSRWSELRKLKYVFLDGTSVDDAALDYLARIDSLETIIVDGGVPRITDDGLRALSRLPNLKFLALCGAEIGDTGLLHLKEAPALQEICLDRTRVSKQGIDALRAARPDLTMRVD